MGRVGPGDGAEAVVVSVLGAGVVVELQPVRRVQATNISANGAILYQPGAKPQVCV